jgi:hypothetical protein
MTKSEYHEKNRGKNESLVALNEAAYQVAEMSGLLSASENS